MVGAGGFEKVGNRGREGGRSETGRDGAKGREDGDTLAMEMVVPKKAH